MHPQNVDGLNKLTQESHMSADLGLGSPCCFLNLAPRCTRGTFHHGQKVFITPNSPFVPFSLAVFVVPDSPIRKRRHCTHPSLGDSVWKTDESPAQKTFGGNQKTFKTFKNFSEVAGRNLHFKIRVPLIIFFTAKNAFF